MEELYAFLHGEVKRVLESGSMSYFVNLVLAYIRPEFSSKPNSNDEFRMKRIEPIATERKQEILLISISFDQEHIRSAEASSSVRITPFSLTNLF